MPYPVPGARLHLLSGYATTECASDIRKHSDAITHHHLSYPCERTPAEPPPRPAFSGTIGRFTGDLPANISGGNVRDLRQVMERNGSLAAHPRFAPAAPLLRATSADREPDQSCGCKTCLATVTNNTDLRRPTLGLVLANDQRALSKRPTHPAITKSIGVELINAIAS